MGSVPDVSPSGSPVRRAGSADAEAIGHLLHDVHREFEEPDLGARALCESVGFSNRGEDSSLMYVYEREL
jgi:hypothetical protein